MGLPKAPTRLQKIESRIEALGQALADPVVEGFFGIESVTAEFLAEINQAAGLFFLEKGVELVVLRKEMRLHGGLVGCCRRHGSAWGPDNSGEEPGSSVSAALSSANGDPQ